MFNGENTKLNEFSINQPQYGSKEFLQSNTIVGKVAFLIIVLFIFIIVLRLGISLLSWFIQGSTSPHFINGIVDAKQMLIFPQDPTQRGSKTLSRSINQHDGVEFTLMVSVLLPIQPAPLSPSTVYVVVILGVTMVVVPFKAPGFQV